MKSSAIAAVCLLLASVSSAHATVMLDHSWVSSNTITSAQTGITYDGLAQTFTVGLDGIFHSAELLIGQIANPAAPTNNLTISLLDTSAGAPNSAIASISVAPGDISSTGLSWFLADFSSANYMVSTGDLLAIAISSTDSYQWNAGVDAEATYAGGQRYSDASGGTVDWSPLSNWDFSLKTYVTTQVPEPTTLALLSLGLIGLGFTRRRMKS